MPTAAPKPCTACGVLVRDGSSRCSKHKIAPGSFADERRGSRHKRGYGSAWDKKREGILRRDEGTCQVHLQQGLIHRGTHVDHKVNKAEWKRLHGSLAGCDDDTNLWCVCVEWHRSKTAREGAQGAGLLTRLLPERGHENSGAPTDRTGLPATFLHARVSGVGGGDEGGEGTQS